MLWTKNTKCIYSGLQQLIGEDFLIFDKKLKYSYQSIPAKPKRIRLRKPQKEVKEIPPINEGMNDWGNVMDFMSYDDK